MTILVVTRKQLIWSRYLSLLDEEGIDVPRTRAVLMAALKYHTFVEYSEAHII